jgi:NADH:ubiquinone oxidoreductase subunit 2 (subunit N)
MYMRDPEPEPAAIDGHPFGLTALALSVAGVMLLGLFPGPVLDFLRTSAASIF